MSELLLSAVSRVLYTPTPREKAKLVQSIAFNVSREAAAASVPSFPRVSASSVELPNPPARPPFPELMDPPRMPTHKQLGVPVSTYLLHGLAHIELNAMDMYADTIARGLATDLLASDAQRAELAADFLSVLRDESRHYMMLEDRLHELHSKYGAIPARELLRLAGYGLPPPSQALSSPCRHTVVGACYEHSR